MSFHGDTVLDFSCQKQKSLLVEIFFVGLQLSLWTDNVLAKVRFFLRCLIDAV